MFDPRYTRMHQGFFGELRAVFLCYSCDDSGRSDQLQLKHQCLRQSRSLESWMRALLEVMMYP